MEKLLLIISAFSLIICLCLGAYSILNDGSMPKLAFDGAEPSKNESTDRQTEANTADSLLETDPVSDVIIETTAALPAETEIIVETESDTDTESYTDTETEASAYVDAETSDGEDLTEWTETTAWETEWESETEFTDNTEDDEGYVTEFVDTEAVETETEAESVYETETRSAPEQEQPKVPEIAASVRVPILMYHALTEKAEEASDTVITARAFEEQIAAITEAGYTSIFFGDLRDYVKEGKALPEKTVLITFDDGYTSNLTIAAPILQKYGQKATVSVIGVSVGKDTYKDTGVTMYPHFTLEEARAAYEQGIMDFQSHTYDMHQISLDEDPRIGMLPKENETEEEYAAALRLDFAASKAQIEQGVGNEVFVIVYPHGKSNPLLDEVLSSSGAEISVTVEAGINVVEYGNTASLRSLCRINMDDGVSGEMLTAMLEEYING